MVFASVKKVNDSRNEWGADGRPYKASFDRHLISDAFWHRFSLKVSFALVLMTSPLYNNIPK